MSFKEVSTENGVLTPLITIKEKAYMIIEGLNEEEIELLNTRLPKLSKKALARNRYSNIVPYENTRVRLDPMWKEACDYINASIVKIPSGKTFIATQGPTSNSIDVFWKMVWQSVPKSGIIVMLTKLRERHRLKCDIYWPVELFETLNIGDLSVILVKVYTLTSLNEVQVREFELNKDGVKKKILHFYYNGWPDFGAPHTFSLLSLTRYIKSLSYSPDFETAPIIVHCSAGCGRTGTFMALFEILSQTDDSTSTSKFEVDNIANIVSSLRSQRMQSVQSVDQLVFLYTVSQELLQGKEFLLPQL
ncbi:Protein-tyrosine phosphatase Pyp3 [Schizosaccharomyces pombe]|uniref:Tyrosine-protein phosphatase 3 n=1 Tax=Schizosaccharomyces pombe (strain 972 / ATCC 24843) TaxID=284812 RepID=PYP3_SCHPO|nr:protein-tyrosine phosphatase Pyp3 [Schizosaccharomyces pombe]P32587.1 RecName: Full=Tyrosine-protein phosphatase 3; AltName: Full=Protein-tyrosine phosphatase 3; Short=PTPase 3 [Schizosaccharomyces pombe 972h-]CAA49609.1 protein-tyrosine phosphatase [Schizosaccharomyces pombe]CAB11188.1 protein-tyrosine phosphatase Pyp3 [Schizosaccharomyces pombe]|eukprot:NP_594934.1 protein-tyrosine phosphatase Pyp3 [Schizosaccharomyces pombe]